MLKNYSTLYVKWKHRKCIPLHNNWVVIGDFDISKYRINSLVNKWWFSLWKASKALQFSFFGALMELTWLGIMTVYM